MTEDEMVRWHHRLEFEQILGDSEEQGGPACCSPWGHKESDMTEPQNNNNPEQRKHGLWCTSCSFNGDSLVFLDPLRTGPRPLNPHPV